MKGAWCIAWDALPRSLARISNPDVSQRISQGARDLARAARPPRHGAATTSPCMRCLSKIVRCANISTRFHQLHARIVP